jgi:predicted transcriptional regulator
LFLLVVVTVQSHEFMNMLREIVYSIGKLIGEVVVLTVQEQVQFRFGIDSKLALLRLKKDLKVSSGAKRGRMEIIAEILLLCERENAKTSIMYKTNLNYAQLQSHLSSLTTIGMLTQENGLYLTTEKGFRFLELYAELQGILRNQNT